MKNNKSLLFFIMLIVSITCMMIEVRAAVIHVTTTNDKVAGSLRAAITTANKNSEKDTIYLPAGTYLLTGAPGEDANASGDLDFNSAHNITIIGDGRNVTIIDGNHVDRVLHILKGNVSITGVTIQNGKTPDAAYLKNSEWGGGIINKGTLELSHCTVSNNATGIGGWCHAHSPGEIAGNSGSGGGIINFGTLIFTRCNISNNSTGRGGNGGISQNGGISGSGAGIFNYSGTITLTGCTISDNKAGTGGEACGGNDGGSGGGIFNSENAKLQCYQCTFNDNSAGDGGDGGCGGGDFKGGDGGSGGGIFNSGYTSLTNCTISHNRTGVGGSGDNPIVGYTGSGGGISTVGSESTCQTYLINCTIVNNYIDEGPDILNAGNGGGLYNSGGVAELTATIVANNHISIYGSNGPDGWGTFNTRGYNLVKDISFCNFYSTQPGEIFGKDPKLGPLAENGGPTKTHALLPGSPAIDAGKAPGLSIDQRGFPRPVNIPGIPNITDGSDIGAFEYSPNCLISGTIFYENTTTGLSGVTLTFTDIGGTVSTDNKGFYSRSLPQGWTGIVTPIKAGYKFSPQYRSYSTIQADQKNQDYNADPLSQPSISLNRTHLNFGAVDNNSQTGTQTFSITNSGGGILNWEVEDDANWLNCSPISGQNDGTITVTVVTAGLAAGTYTGTITISAAGVSNSPQEITVTLEVYASQGSNSPFGYFETPADNSNVNGSIPVTGWTLDDIGVENVKIYRVESPSLIYIGDAVFVEGARPDVELAYPNYPNNYKAGWGYMLLTNFLPNNGNGSFTLQAVAIDKEGNQATLGQKTINVDNAHAVKPFGAIDTPAQGGLATGASYRNAGWALTPPPNKIPEDGHTITVWIDGLKVGNPHYNIYRPDVAALFPGYANSNGAHAYLDFNTTAYENGMHTIMWTAKDDAGNTGGIGSRYFTIQNATDDKADKAISTTDAAGRLNILPSLFPGDYPDDYPNSIRIQKGYHSDRTIQTLYPDPNGDIKTDIKELMRIEIHFNSDEEEPGVNETSDGNVNEKWWGFLKVGEQLKKLPVGSSLDIHKGIFYWNPGPGFIGTYHMVFIRETKTGTLKKREVTIKIIPKF